MSSTILSFSLLLNVLFCLLHYFNSLPSSDNTQEEENRQLGSSHTTSSSRDISPRSHTHTHTHDQDLKSLYTPPSSQSSTDSCDNPECPVNKGTETTNLTPEQQIFAQLGTIKEILDGLPTIQQNRMNAFLGTLESRRFEEDLPTTYASLSRQNKETSESDVIRAYQQFKEYRFEEVAADDVANEGDMACCDRPKGTYTGVDKILAEFSRAREIRKKSHLIGTLLLEDALESMRERDKRLAFGRYGVDKPKRRQSMVDSGLDAIEEVATPMVGSPFVRGVATPGREIGNPFQLDGDMGKGLAKRKVESMVGKEADLAEEEDEEGGSFL